MTRDAVTSLLHAFGDSSSPLPETVRVLDEIVTDFIIETCHLAARSAAYSRRQKIKVDDFKFAIRGDEVMLGRVQELLGMERELREARRQFEVGEGKVGLERGKGEGKGGRGKKSGKVEEVGDEEEE